MMIGGSAGAGMGAGAAMLITVALVFAALILFEWSQNRRAKRREAARREAAADVLEDRGAAAATAVGGFSLWRWLFGPPAGQEQPYNPMDDVHPDELEGSYDHDGPPREL